MSYAKPGSRVVVTELGERPLEAIAEHLSIEPQPPPDPAQLESTDVVIAVRSAAVGWVDLLMTSGQYQHVPEPPYTPGLEYAGEVVYRGAEVTHVDVGDAVLVDGVLAGPRSKGAHRRWGGFASYAVAPAAAVLLKPDPLDFDQAAIFLGAYGTAYHVLFHRGDLKASDVVLIHGASGTTGLAAVHLAKLAGATVIATWRSQEKLDVVAAQGADHVICTADSEGGLARLRPEVKALTGGRGVDVVYDPVGGDISIESLRCVAFGARFLIVGWAATPFVAKGKGGRGAPRANVLPTNLMMMKGLDVRGCPAVISAMRDPRMHADRIARIVAWAQAGRIAPVVSERFPLARVVDALHAKWESRAVGGIALHPSTD